MKNDITMVNVKKHGTIMVKVNNSITKINVQKHGITR